MIETDIELRKRIEYVAGPSHEVAISAGGKLDEIASRYNLRRRILAPSPFAGWIK